MSKVFRDVGIILKFILLFQHTDIPADSSGSMLTFQTT